MARRNRWAVLAILVAGLAGILAVTARPGHSQGESMLRIAIQADPTTLTGCISVGNTDLRRDDGDVAGQLGVKDRDTVALRRCWIWILGRVVGRLGRRRRRGWSRRREDRAVTGQPIDAFEERLRPLQEDLARVCVPHAVDDDECHVVGVIDFDGTPIRLARLGLLRLAVLQVA